MKIFMSVDIEGVACVVHSEEGKLEGVEYERARRWMTWEANAAIEGALTAGATEIVVADSHGHMRNLLADELHEEAQLIRGAPRPLGMMHGIDDSYDAVFFVGYHAMEGAKGGILAHTYSGLALYEVQLNGKVLGETGFNAAIAGYCGVPVALVTGDDGLEAEAKSILPWTERVVTKWVYNFYSARNLTPKMSQRQIREGATQALARLSEMKPFEFKPPYDLQIKFKRALYADMVEVIPGVQRVDGRTVTYTSDDLIEVSRVRQLMTTLSRV